MKNFTIFSLIYFALLGFFILIFAHDLLSSEYVFSISLLGFSREFSLPYVYLIIVPALLYALIFLLASYFGSIKQAIEDRRIKKDAKLFESYAAALVLGGKIPAEFKSQAFKKITPLVKELAINQASCEGGELASALALKASIKAGVFNQCKLNKSSELFRLNRKNLCASDIAEAKFELKNKSQIDDEISAAAYENLLKNADYADIKCLKIPKSPAMIMQILNRIKASSIELSNAEIEVLLNNSQLSEAEFLQAAKILRSELEASVMQALFSKLKDAHEAAFRAYLYTLCALGLNEEFQEATFASEAPLEDFKLILFLKEHAKNYELDRLIY